jgi:hypothetical protein
VAQQVLRGPALCVEHVRVRLEEPRRRVDQLKVSEPVHRLDLSCDRDATVVPASATPPAARPASREPQGLDRVHDQGRAGSCRTGRDNKAGPERSGRRGARHHLMRKTSTEMATSDDSSRDANQFGWPLERTDFAALCNALIAIGCLVFGKSEWITGLALLLATFAVLSPRMRRGSVAGPGFSFSGDFVTRGYASSGDEPPQLPGGAKKDAGAPSTPALEADSADRSPTAPPDIEPGSG